MTEVLTKTAAETLLDGLAQYYGGDQVYKHSLNPRFNYTAGVRHFAQNAGNGAYWLLDILATEPSVKALIKEEGFGIAILKVNKSGKATLVVKADTYAASAYEREIRHTDTPAGEWKFYLEQTEVGSTEVALMMLPRER